jgi:hypothetical protein
MELWLLRGGAERGGHSREREVRRVWLLCRGREGFFDMMRRKPNVSDPQSICRYAFVGLPDVEFVEAVGPDVEDAPRELARQLVVRHVQVRQVRAVLGQRLVAVDMGQGRQAEWVTGTVAEEAGQRRRRWRVSDWVCRWE